MKESFYKQVLITLSKLITFGLVSLIIRYRRAKGKKSTGWIRHFDVNQDGEVNMLDAVERSTSLSEAHNSDRKENDNDQEN